MNVFAGVVLAELFIVLLSVDVDAAFRTITTLVTVPMLFLALLLMSIPMDNYRSSTWSTTIMDFFRPMFPTFTDPPRQPISLGAQLLGLSIVLSPLLRQLFVLRPLLWLGKVSFGIYLLHGPLMRSVLSWCLYLGSTPLEIPEQVKAEPAVLLYPLPGKLRIGVSLVVFLTVLGGVVQLWTVKMEPVFAKLTKKAEDLMFAKVVDTLTPLGVSPGMSPSKLETDMV